jgi:hypothetical protein
MSRFFARLCVAGLLLLFAGHEGSSRGINRLLKTQPLIANYHVVGTACFQAMRGRIVSGRAFDTTDTADAPEVVIINETLARRLWPTQDALGQYIAVGFGEPSFRKIVGIVADIGRSSCRAESPVAEVYLPATQCAMQPVFSA